MLITQTYLSGFSLYKVNGYSKEHSQLNLSEQVEGYREFYQFELMHENQYYDALKKALTPVCSSANVRYWLTDITDEGRF